MYSFLHRLIIQPFLDNRNKVHPSLFYGNLLESQYWSADLLRQNQLEMIKKLVKHAYLNTSFYEDRFRKVGLTPQDIRSLEDLKAIPPITREDLNNNLDDMTARNILSSDVHKDATGGSTGLATHFVRDNACLSIKKASEHRFNSWSGWKPGEKILYYWPAIADFTLSNNRPSVAKQLLIGRELQIYAGRLDPGILSQHAETFAKFRPHLVRAFPNSLQIFAEYALERDLSFSIPRGIISVGEPINRYQRTIFKKVFRCDVLNCYVSRECGNIACECESHSGLHIADELLFLEIESPQVGTIGKIYVTDICNMGMPLIRYDIQDASKWLPGKCNCGRTLMRIDLNASRLTDHLISPVDGSLISGSSVVHYLLAEGPKVNRFQLIQDARDHILIRMAGTYESNEKGIMHIQSIFEKLFGGKMRFDIDFVDSIEFLQSGKYQFLKRTFEG